MMLPPLLTTLLSALLLSTTLVYAKPLVPDEDLILVQDTEHAVDLLTTLRHDLLGRIKLCEDISQPEKRKPCFRVIHDIYMAAGNGTTPADSTPPLSPEVAEFVALLNIGVEGLEQSPIVHPILHPRDEPHQAYLCRLAALRHPIHQMSAIYTWTESLSRPLHWLIDRSRPVNYERESLLALRWAMNRLLGCLLSNIEHQSHLIGQGEGSYWFRSAYKPRIEIVKSKLHEEEIFLDTLISE